MKSTFLFLFIGLTGISLSAKSQPTSFDVKPGYLLIYKVNATGDIYNFEVTVKRFVEIGIIFNYYRPKKTNAAKIDISSNPVSNANSLVNYFKGRDQ